MESTLLQQLVTRQQAYFQTGATMNYDFRKQQLRRLLELVQAHEAAIAAALMQDLRKSPMEAYATEIGVVMEELRYHLRHLR